MLLSNPSGDDEPALGGSGIGRLREPIADPARSPTEGGPREERP